MPMEGDLLRVSTPAPAREYRRPIDTFYNPQSEVWSLSDHDRARFAAFEEPEQKPAHHRKRLSWGVHRIFGLEGDTAIFSHGHFVE